MARHKRSRQRLAPSAPLPPPPPPAETGAHTHAVKPTTARRGMKRVVQFDTESEDTEEDEAGADARYARACAAEENDDAALFAYSYHTAPNVAAVAAAAAAAMGGQAAESR
mmetsp:Transcript_18635/g.46389  ORF Transcript_18635/g.46389 Transcript_18635/m.46389 type:complete len:111 (+) Transcript_18635:484-816(+)